MNKYFWVFIATIFTPCAVSANELVDREFFTLDYINQTYGGVSMEGAGLDTRFDLPLENTAITFKFDVAIVREYF